MQLSTICAFDIFMTTGRASSRLLLSSLVLKSQSRGDSELNLGLEILFYDPGFAAAD
jgi:hypothetical protein